MKNFLLFCFKIFISFRYISNYNAKILWGEIFYISSIILKKTASKTIKWIKAWIQNSKIIMIPVQTTHHFVLSNLKCLIDTYILVAKDATFRHTSFLLVLLLHTGQKFTAFHYVQRICTKKFLLLQRFYYTFLANICSAFDSQMA